MSSKVDDIMHSSQCRPNWRHFTQEERGEWGSLWHNKTDETILFVQMYMQMAEQENKAAAPAIQAHTPVEKKISVQRSFASKAQ